ncbi:dynein regulatory complex subunit 7 [Pelobates cultripes]|uniref:Dynein regulatory complex subunit 7 n=1 Tax=Pelobates cultripes TaxID=61616 RepID=A0AAD1THT8_PELCU|nr:dynein regulatory complex subunit 7 [Pelobates cultripes]
MMMMDRIPIKLESRTRIPLISPPMRKGFPAMRRSSTLRRFLRKFVCTTLRPTLIPYPELYNWAECACFVSEYLTMQPLDPPHDLPHSLFSSNTVLQKQQGNCFDFSVLLCSLLLGAGYDAYCVSGYATKEMCVMDESREVCPLLLKQKESLGEISVKHTKKYSVKPPRQFISKFEVEQESKREEQIHLAQHKQQEEEKQRLKVSDVNNVPLPLTPGRPILVGLPSSCSPMGPKENIMPD